MSKLNIVAAITGQTLKLYKLEPNNKAKILQN
jgi:hypothetical protein